MKSHFTKLWRKRARRAPEVHRKPLYRLGGGLEALEDRRLLAFTTPIINFPGQTGGFLSDNPIAPPDTIGDVDDEYFVQAVNHAMGGSSVVIYNKSDGSVALGPFSMSSLATSGPCVAGAGDPMVAYDHFAERWILGQFTNDVPEDQHLCVFVSATSDPTDNRWHVYDIPTQEFPDYPKFAVTPGGGWVISTNEQGVNPTPAVYALDRENMLQGLPARPAQRFVAPPDGPGGAGFQFVTPADIDGPAAPANSPAYFMRRIDDEYTNPDASNVFFDFLEVYELHANFDDPAQSSFSRVQVIQVPDFDIGPPILITQPGTDIELLSPSSLAGIVHRLQYRNFGTHETLVGTFTVIEFTTPSGDEIAGLRWFELRKNQGSSQWQLHQFGEFSPDFNEYFMGSIAMDGEGNIALGYNVSSSGISPTLRYVGRRATDPPNLMTTQQVTLANGQGFEMSGRWGDYAAMLVDPTDDRTFWFTGEFALNGNWGTQIAAFAFPEPLPPPPPPPGPLVSVSGVVYHDVNGNGERNLPNDIGVGDILVYVDLDRDGRMDLLEPGARTNADGTFTLPPIPPGTYDVRVVAPPSWQQTQPEGGAAEEITITASGDGPPPLEFGITGGNLYDFGNTGPVDRQTLLANNGARHGVLNGFQLGPTVGGEVDARADDVNDGVTFSQTLGDSPVLISGAQANIAVNVRTSGQARGYLQAWIDLNQDGDFNDPGEKVISDLRLGEGTHNLSFPVPAGAATGVTTMRFRYGWELGLGPKGPSMAGEVEDYQVTMFGNSPQAIDDDFIVPQGDARLLDVLVNDFASSSGGLRILSVQSPTAQGGTAVIQDGQIFYTTPTGFSGTDSFTYTVTDDSGQTDTATVTITVPPTFTRPVANDDQAFASSNTPSSDFFVDIDVMANDIRPNPSTTRITAIPVTPANGTAIILVGATAEQDRIRYQAAPGFVGTDQFVYRITDDQGNSSTATVTVFVGDAFADDKVQYTVEFRTPDGSQVIDQVQAGQEFLAVVRVEDVRNKNDVPGDDVAPTDLGVFAAYLDLLYNFQHVTLIGEPIFDGDYTQDPEFDTSIPGTIDEAGAFRDVDLPFADLPGQRVLFTALFRANDLGPDQPGSEDDQVLTTFVPDPAEDIDPGAGVGDHDTTLYVPASKVPIDQITYLANTLLITRDAPSASAMPEGENPLHNYESAHDVNADGRVNTYDVLLVVSRLIRGEAEGEAPATTYFYDTNNDGRISSADLVSIINYLVRGGSNGEGEAVAESTSVSEPLGVPSVESPLAPSRIDVLPPSATSAGSTAASTGLPSYDVPSSEKSEHDEALAQLLNEEDSELEDDYFAELLSGWSRD